MDLPDPLKNLFNRLNNWNKPPDPLIAIAEKVLAREGEAVAELVGRPLSYTQGISFKVNAHEQGVANTFGKVVTLFKYHCDPNPEDVEGVVVHELAHAIQRGAKYGGEFTWMVEGLADFVRYKLGYGIILPGDPRQSYKIAGGFFNWLYEYPGPDRSSAATGSHSAPAHHTYYAFVKELNAGIRPGNLDALLREYNSGGGKAVTPPRA